VRGTIDENIILISRIVLSDRDYKNDLDIVL
jgi:hypothetical protein